MKNIKELIDSAITNNIWVGSRSHLEDFVKNAVMYSFQNTTEDFNMESIQGESEMTNDEIYKRLTL